MRQSSTRSSRWRAVVGLMAAASAGCLTSEDVSLGRNTEQESAPEAEAPATSDDAGPQLGAAILATTGTVCAGQCVELSAAASGGAGEYTYTWGEGLGEGPGPWNVCPTRTTTYDLTVDSSSSSTSSNTIASATFTVTVDNSCDAGTTQSTAPDSGPATMAGPDDSGTTAGGQGFCVPNPTFNAPSVSGIAPTSASSTAPSDWQVCSGSASSTLGTPPSDLPPEGQGYVVLSVGTGVYAQDTETLGTTLCSPLEPREEYSFCVNLGAFADDPTTELQGAPTTVLQVWGGTSSCDQAVLLWTSPAITSAVSKDCGSFFPPQEVTNIVLVPSETGSVTGIDSLSGIVVYDITSGPP